MIIKQHLNLTKFLAIGHCTMKVFVINPVAFGIQADKVMNANPVQNWNAQSPTSE